MNAKILLIVFLLVAVIAFIYSRWIVPFCLGSEWVSNEGWVEWGGGRGEVRGCEPETPETSARKRELEKIKENYTLFGNTVCGVECQTSYKDHLYICR